MAFTQRRANERRANRVLNIAHRGARAFAPENTLEAIDKAADLGADIVEIDVHLSADGALVVTHDLAEGVTLAEILRGDPRVPTLAQSVERALSLSMLVNVELKNLPKRQAHIEERVVAAVERLDAVGHVLVSSFDHESLAVVRRLNDAIATAVLTDDRLFRPVAYLSELDADALHPGGYIPDRDTIEAIRASGRGVNVWTENDPDRMRLLIEAGVTGIITDYPNRLRDLLDGNGRSLDAPGLESTTVHSFHSRSHHRGSGCG
jgi:glycerophosphoryl diester phosphodiesterase